MIKRVVGTVILAMGIAGLYGCSMGGNVFTPEEVIQNALKETNELPSYYAEAKFVMTNNDEIEEESIVKEWRSKDGKIRIEMDGIEGKHVSLNDGKQFLMYNEDAKQAFISEDAEVLATLAPSMKEQAERSLNIVKDTHTVEVKGEEKIAGREAYHIIATANEKDSIVGDQQLWIDKENWMTLKVISTSGNTVVTMEYEKIDLHYNIKDSDFEIDLPDDVEVEDIDDALESEEVLVEDLKQALELDALYIPEQGELTIDKIEVTKLEGQINRIEAAVEYQLNDTPAFSLSMFEAPVEVDEDIQMPEEEPITIRGVEGTKIDMEMFRMLSWTEDGMNYVVLINDPDLPFEKVVGLTETMELLP